MTEPPAPRPMFAWGSYQRWFLRGRVFRLAIQARLLTLASLGVLSTIGGWWALANVFSGTDEAPLKLVLAAYDTCPWRSPPADVKLSSGVLSAVQLSGDQGPNLGAPPTDAFFDPWRRLSMPLRLLFDVSRTIVGAAFLLLAAVWAAAVWAVFGGAITRAVAVHLTREEAISIGSANRHVARRFKAYFTAPLFPLVGIAALTLPAIVIGLLMKVSLLLGGLLWPIALVIGLVGAVLLAGLSVGWPLMSAAVSAEGSDSFDALSRSYSYVYQRPLNYLAYAVTAFVLGLLGLIVVDLFAEAVWTLAAWTVSWGSGSATMLDALNEAAKHGPVDAWGAKLFWLWRGLVDLIVLGFAFSFFWTASTAIYLLLRYDVDGVDPGEVYMDDSGDAFGLPPLAKDAAGVPVVPAEPAAVDPPPKA